MLRIRQRGLALGFLLIAAAACGGDDSDESDESDDNEDSAETAEAPATTATSGEERTGGSMGEAPCDETVPGSELTFSAYNSPGQLDPTLIAGGVVGGTEIAAIYDELFTYNYDNNEVEPHLAEGITANDDFTEFTLQLRDGVTFSDGTPLDAQMVADNIDRYLEDTSIAPHRAFLSLIAEKNVVDDVTLELTMSRPWAEFPTFLAEQPGMIVNINAIGDDPDEFAANPPEAAGVGPYVLRRNAPGEEIVLEARDDYWGGPVCVETLRIVALGGSSQAYDAFQNEELDVAYLRDPVTVAATQQDGVQGDFLAVDIGIMLMLNLRDGSPGNDPRLREAIWLAMDPDVINERGYQGELNTSMSLIHPESAWGSDDLAVVEHDPDRARELVEDAQADGLDASIEILQNTVPPAPEVALAWQGLLEAVGFDVTVEPAQVNDLIAQVFRGDYQGANFALSVEPAQITTRLYGALHSEGANNRWGYVSDEMDAALIDAMSAPADERTEAVARINDIYVNDFVTPVLANNLDGIIWQDDVSGVISNPTQIFLFHRAHVDGG